MLYLDVAFSWMLHHDLFLFLIAEKDLRSSVFLLWTPYFRKIVFELSKATSW